MNKDNIVLSGFMGTGKTTVGMLLALKLNYTFVDTDQEIEAQQGRSIAEIFAEEGEEFFRKLETETAIKLSAGKKQVIATGGKLMLNPVNSKSLNKTSHIFCLTASVEEIIKRVSADSGAVRPLLVGDSPEKTVRSLLEERQEGYAQFRQIDTTGLSPQEIVEQIVALTDH